MTLHVESLPFLAGPQHKNATGRRSTSDYLYWGNDQIPVRTRGCSCQDPCEVRAAPGRASQGSGNELDRSRP